MSLTASSKDDAESIKSYAGKLNAEYGFHPYDEDVLTGIEYVDDGILYRHGAPDSLKRFLRFSQEIAAYFSDIELVYTEFNSDNQGTYSYRSQNGKLHQVKECMIELHAADEFDRVRDAAVFMTDKLQLELNRDDDLDHLNVVTFKYDELTEKEKLNAVLDYISETLPDIEVVCIKVTDDCCEAPYDSYCIIRNGTYLWRHLDYNINQMMTAVRCPWNENDDYEKIRRFDVVRNPLRAVEKLLARIRNGESYPGDEYVAASLILDESEYQSQCLDLMDM